MYLHNNPKQGTLLAIDPGNEQSAFCFVDIETYRPLYFAKESNQEAMQHMIEVCSDPANNVICVAIEMLASYGMNIGRTCIETAKEIGRFQERLSDYVNEVNYIYRKDEKMCICGHMQAKDSNVRQALIDRFAEFDTKNGKGTKNNPDWFYGFKADIWQSYAVAVCWIDGKRGLYTLNCDEKGEIKNGE